MVGVLRKEGKDGDYCKTMSCATVGGREGVRGGRSQWEQACLWSCCGCWTNGTCRRLSVAGRDEGEMSPTALCRAGTGRCSGL